MTSDHVELPRQSGLYLVKAIDGAVAALEIGQFYGPCYWVQGARCKTREELFVEFSAALRFPQYFSGNWDSFDECISDMSWLHAKAHVIIISDAESLLRLGEDLDVLCEILRDDTDEREEYKEGPALITLLLLEQCRGQSLQNRIIGYLTGTILWGG